MWLRYTLFLLMEITLRISVLHKQVVCDQGEMFINSTVQNTQGYKRIVFNEGFYNNFIDCMINNAARCKAYYYYDQLKSVYNVYNTELGDDVGNNNSVYQCTDAHTLNYVICSNVFKCLNPHSIQCFSPSFGIIWNDNNEYLYNLRLRNCTLSCDHLERAITIGYELILLTTFHRTLIDSTTTVEHPNSKTVFWTNSTNANTEIHEIGKNNVTTIIVVVVVVVVIAVMCIMIGILLWRRHRNAEIKQSSVNRVTDRPRPNNKSINCNESNADNSNRYVIQINTEIKSDHVDDYTTIDDSDIAKMSRIVITNTEHYTGDYTELEIDEQSSVNGSVLASSSLDTEDTTSSNNVNIPESDGHIDYSDIKFDPPNTTYARLGEDNRQLTNPYGGLADIKEVSNLSPYTLAKDIPGQTDLQIIDPGCFNKKD